jgi:small subunit ribosomal protein S20
VPNHKSTIKRVRQTKRRTLRNKTIRTGSRTIVKKARQAIEAGNKEEAQTELKATIKALYSSVTKGVMTKNAAARTVSRLTRQTNKL